MKQKSFFIILSLITFFLFCDNPTDTDKNDEKQGFPKPGQWTATVEFGGFDFVVNDESTYITEITYKFEDWNCGGVIRSGSISVSSNPGWTVSDRNFTITNDIDTDPFKKESFTISGSFSENGDQASGTWETVFKGTTYNGDWDAMPNNY